MLTHWATVSSLCAVAFAATTIQTPATPGVVSSISTQSGLPGAPTNFSLSSYQPVNTNPIPSGESITSGVVTTLTISHGDGSFTDVYTYTKPTAVPRPTGTMSVSPTGTASNLLPSTNGLETATSSANPTVYKIDRAVVIVSCTFIAIVIAGAALL